MALPELRVLLQQLLLLRLRMQQRLRLLLRLLLLRSPVREVAARA